MWPRRERSLDALDLAKRVVELAEDKQAADIVLLDIRPISIVADYFVIFSGGSERQLNALTRERHTDCARSPWATVRARR